MKGVIVFLIIFMSFFAATLGFPDLPPGRQFYDLLGVPETDYPIAGISATTFVIAVFNGAVYGLIAWLIFTAAERARKLKT